MFSQNLVNYFNPRSLVREPVRSHGLVEDADGVADRASGYSFLATGWARQHVGAGSAGVMAPVPERQLQRGRSARMSLGSGPTFGFSGLTITISGEGVVPTRSVTPICRSLFTDLRRPRRKHSASGLATVQFSERGCLRPGHLENHEVADLDLRYPRDPQFESGESARCAAWRGCQIVGRDFPQCESSRSMP